MRQMKKKWNGRIAAGLIAVCLSAAAGTTAFFTDKDLAENRFRTASPQVGLRETDWNPEEGDGQNMYPGYSVYKNPTIKNLSADKNEAVYTRMIVTVRNSEGKQIQDDIVLNLIKQTIYYDNTYSGSYQKKGSGNQIIQGRQPGYSLKMLTGIPMINPDFQFDEKRSLPGKWIFNYLGSDGTGVLMAAEESCLFTDIVIPTDWSREEMDMVGMFTLDIVQESIQTNGFNDQNAAYQALDQVIKKGDF